MIRLLGIILLTAIAGFKVPQTGEIKVSIKKMKSDKGVLIVALFNSKEDFLEKSFRTKVVQIADAGSAVVFNNLPAGRYAVSIIHDENENGKLDSNWAGIPKEPFGFSKKSLARFGPPSFEDTSFDIADNSMSVEVEMKSIL